MSRIIILLMLFGLYSCKDRGVYTYLHWKYDSGYSIGDVLSFGEGEAHTFRNDTIFLNGHPKAAVLRIEKHLWVSDILVIKVLGTEKEGRYIGK